MFNPKNVTTRDIITIILLTLPLWIYPLFLGVRYFHNSILFREPGGHEEIMNGRKSVFYNPGFQNNKLGFKKFTASKDVREIIPLSFKGMIALGNVNQHFDWNFAPVAIDEDGSVLYMNYSSTTQVAQILRYKAGKVSSIGQVTLESDSFAQDAWKNYHGPTTIDDYYADMRGEPHPYSRQPLPTDTYNANVYGIPFILTTDAELGIADPVYHNISIKKPGSETQQKIRRFSIEGNSLAENDVMTWDLHDAAISPFLVNLGKAICGYTRGCTIEDDSPQYPNHPDYLILHKGTLDEAKLYYANITRFSLGDCNSNAWIELFGCLSYESNSLRISSKDGDHTLFRYNEISTTHNSRYIRLLGVTPDQKLAIFMAGQKTYALELSTGKTALIVDQASERVLYVR